MSALDARQMGRDAVDAGSLKKAPEVRKNCVRVYYDGGYHVDIPVYRRVVMKDFVGHESMNYELASVDWKRSDARDVTKWFEDENTKQSPDTTNGRQLRRMTRDIKKFAKSRSSRSEEHTSELPSLMRISYAVCCLKKKNNTQYHIQRKYETRRTHEPE